MSYFGVPKDEPRNSRFRDDVIHVLRAHHVSSEHCVLHSVAQRDVVKLFPNFRLKELIFLQPSMSKLLQNQIICRNTIRLLSNI